MKKKQVLQPLAKGQLWRAGDKLVEIVELGKRLAHYKFLNNANQKGAMVRMAGIHVVENYLKTNTATLIRPGQPQQTLARN
jgi:hypothetical protein